MLRYCLTVLCMLGLLFATTGPSYAQSTANLIADELTVSENGTVIARGNVEVWQNGLRFKATQVQVNPSTGELIVTGPIEMQDGEKIVIFADAARIDPNLRQSILLGAQMVLDGQVQLAAAEIQQSGARYTQAYKVAATSCHICKNKAPLWQIRAKRIVHDKDEQQLYFHHAQLRFWDVPVLYLPRVRLPDPSLKRARGFLVPTFENSSLLGWGTKIPYFVPIGDHKDITLTPFISADTTTVELQYRQAFSNGDMVLNGALSQDKIAAGTTRGYLFGTAEFDIARGYQLNFNLEAVNDTAYLSDYNYSNKDRLTTSVELSRANRGKTVDVTLATYTSLRDGENNAELPTIVTHGTLEERIPLAFLNSEAAYELSFFGSYQYSDADVVGFDAARMSAAADWFADHGFANGMIASFETHARADAFSIRQNSNFASLGVNTTVTTATTLRWPWAKAHENGGVTVIEPTIQLVYSDTFGSDVPNQDSTRVEFDTGNLMGLSRMPGYDATETGLRANVGLTWSHEFANSSHLAWSIGKVYRGSNPNTFSQSSGLQAKHSDWLVEASFEGMNGLDLTTRNILGSNGGFQKSETRAAYTGGDATLAATHVWLAADLAEDRPISVSDLQLDGAYAVTGEWTIAGNMKYDFRTSEPINAGLKAIYQNECIEMSLSASRRFSGSTTVQSNTDFGLSVSLLGFGTSATNTSKHRCGG